MLHLEREGSVALIDDAERRYPGIPVRGRRLLAHVAGEDMALAREAEAGPEQRARIGHQREAGKAVDERLSNHVIGCRAQEVAAGMAETDDPGAELRCDGQDMGAVLERDQWPGLGRLGKERPHRSGIRMVPSMISALSPPIPTASPLSSH